MKDQPTQIGKIILSDIGETILIQNLQPLEFSVEGEVSKKLKSLGIDDVSAHEEEYQGTYNSLTHIRKSSIASIQKEVINLEGEEPSSAYTVIICYGVTDYVINCVNEEEMNDTFATLNAMVFKNEDFL